MALGQYIKSTIENEDWDEFKTLRKKNSNNNKINSIIKTYADDFEFVKEKLILKHEWSILKIFSKKSSDPKSLSDLGIYR